MKCNAELKRMYKKFMFVYLASMFCSYGVTLIIKQIALHWPNASVLTVRFCVVIYVLATFLYVINAVGFVYSLICRYFCREVPRFRVRTSKYASSVKHLRAHSVLSDGKPILWVWGPFMQKYFVTYTNESEDSIKQNDKNNN